MPSPFPVGKCFPSDLENTLHTRLVSDADELAQRLGLDDEWLSGAHDAVRDFPLLFPESILDRVTSGDPLDPVLAQFAPDPRELLHAEGFSRDPLAEWGAEPNGEATGSRSCVLQKYEGRALILTTPTCAAKCRFCFRRWFPAGRTLFPIPSEYLDGTAGSIRQYLDRELAPIRRDPTISELVMSGGDPLTLSTEELTTLLDYIKTIRSVKRVRFHSRVPVLAPERIDEDFPDVWDYATEDGAPLILHASLHVNSPNELSPSALTAIRNLRKKGYVVTSQTVLLKGINDSLEILTELYTKLIDAGVVPYYLFQLDRVQGAAHWEVQTETGRELLRKLAEKLPGYAVPKFAREIPDRPMKTNLSVDTDVD